MNVTALLLSLRLAALVSLILLLISLPLGSWLAFGKWRGRFLIEAVVSLPLVLPPTVLGFYLLIAMGSRSPLGRLWERLFGHGLAFTFEGLVIASLLYSLPFAVQPVVAASGLVTAFVLSFAHTLGEFGVVLMVGGNLPGITRTVSIAIYDSVQSLDYAGANSMAMVLLGFAFLALSIVYAMNRRVWTPWTPR